ncbi:MAG: hypothetical protein P4L87_16675 [Formivibrio sp.]|nr:hypothetical protein [Formivibrio sp.]
MAAVKLLCLLLVAVCLVNCCDATSACGFTESLFVPPTPTSDIMGVALKSSLTDNSTTLGVIVYDRITCNQSEFEIAALSLDIGDGSPMKTYQLNSTQLSCASSSECTWYSDTWMYGPVWLKVNLGMQNNQPIAELTIHLTNGTFSNYTTSPQITGSINFTSKSSTLATLNPLPCGPVANCSLPPSDPSFATVNFNWTSTEPSFVMTLPLRFSTCRSCSRNCGLSNWMESLDGTVAVSLNTVRPQVTIYDTKYCSVLPSMSYFFGLGMIYYTAGNQYIYGVTQINTPGLDVIYSYRDYSNGQVVYRDMRVVIGLFALQSSISVHFQVVDWHGFPTTGAPMPFLANAVWALNSHSTWALKGYGQTTLSQFVGMNTLYIESNHDTGSITDGIGNISTGLVGSISPTLDVRFNPNTYPCTLYMNIILSLRRDCVTGWGDWGPCSQSCFASTDPTSTQNGTQSRNYTIIDPPLNGGKACDLSLAPPPQYQICNTQLCDVDCVMTDWEYSDCNATCGDGYQWRTRNITQPAIANGAECGTTGEWAACHIDCPDSSSSSTAGDFNNTGEAIDLTTDSSSSSSVPFEKTTTGIVVISVLSVAAFLSTTFASIAAYHQHQLKRLHRKHHTHKHHTHKHAFKATPTTEI